MSESQTDFWFPAKKFGWGWGPPVKWQGWMGNGFSRVKAETRIEPLLGRSGNDGNA
jgi:hypothetical protein